MWLVKLFGVLLVLCAPQGLAAAVYQGRTGSLDMMMQELPRSGERFEFQAEVNRLMDILIHSLYSNKDIFLREIISNASDALDKLRTLALSQSDVLGVGEAANLEIRIEVDHVRNMLKIHDRGVGMTKDELITNLGTIAKSGTASFLEKMQQGGDVNLIGQFGVGFYSVYLVADYVEVISKAQKGRQHIWESNAGGAFVITEDPDGTVSGEGDLERGTMIRVHLKQENPKYLQEDLLKELVKKYSEFINFPIYLLTTREVEIIDGSDHVEADDEIADDDDISAAPGESRKRTEVQHEWELLNGQKAIWLRDSKEVDIAEYNNFYASLSKKEISSPLAHSHFRAEGDVEFRAILYVPDEAPWDFYDLYYQRKSSVRLYVRRIFISDAFDDLLPRYLSFLIGIVDSDTLPLSVSREMLQQHNSLKTIKKKLVRKGLDMIKKLSDDATQAQRRLDIEDRESRGSKADVSDEELQSVSAEASKRESLEGAVRTYKKLWDEFGRALKLGIMEDANNRNRLAKLLRVHTTKSNGELIPLDEYTARMRSGQSAIYYICGSSMDEVHRSPYLERLMEEGLEVVLFTEPMDEYMMQNMMDFDEHSFVNVAKEDLKLSEDHDNKKLEKSLQDTFKPLMRWWKQLIGTDGGLDSVRVSSRLSSTPCVVVASKFGWSANMQRIMSAQALGDGQRQAYMTGGRILEINPRHPLIVKLLEQVSENEDDVLAADTGKLLFETALLESGFPLQDHQTFANRVYHLMKQQIGLDRDLGDLHTDAEVITEDIIAEALPDAANTMMTPDSGQFRKRMRDEL